MAYVTHATTKGGRDGRAVLDDGKLALAMALPKDLGGSGEGHNPEQLFALGWSSCFGQAVLLLAKKHGLDGQAARVGCKVELDKDETSFALKAELTLSIPGADKTIAQLESMQTASRDIAAQLDDLGPLRNSIERSVPVGNGRGGEVLRHTFAPRVNAGGKGSGTSVQPRRL